MYNLQQSQVEMYPTFSIKVGCAFDYSAYPFDMQKCAMGLYTNNRMSEVQLSVFYQMQPTVLLGIPLFILTQPNGAYYVCKKKHKNC